MLRHLRYSSVVVLALFAVPAESRAEVDPVVKALVRGEDVRACQMADAGADPADAFFIGTCHASGTGFPPDYDKAAAHFRQAFERYGNRLAQAHLGQLMALGLVEGSADEGLRLALEAAQSGDAEAEMIYGRLLVRLGLPRDQAIRWLMRSAESGFPDGAYELGRLYGTLGDRQQEDFWQRRGKTLADKRGSFADAVAFAESGRVSPSPRDAYNRGRRILIGDERGTQDEAFRLVRYAAYSHLKEAEAQLGLMHLHGIGAPQDREEAIYWFRRAAMKGSADGQRLLNEALASRK